MRPLLRAGLTLTLSAAWAACPAGCGGRPPLEDDRDADAAARDADLDASPLTKPVLPPLVVPPHRVSAVAEQTVAGEPAVAFVTRRPTARTLQRTIDEALAALDADPHVRAAATGSAVIVYRGRTTSIDATNLDATFELDVGLVVPLGTVPRSAGVTVRPLPPMRAVTVTYAGPPAAIDKAYDRLLPEVQSRGLRRTGEVREVFADREAVGTSGRTVPADDELDDDAEVLIAVGVEREAKPDAPR